MPPDQSTEHALFERLQTSLQSLSAGAPSPTITFANPRSRQRVVAALTDIRESFEQHLAGEYRAQVIKTSPDAQAYIDFQDQIQRTIDAILSAGRGSVVGALEQEAILKALLACQDALDTFQAARMARAPQLTPIHAEPKTQSATILVTPPPDPLVMPSVLPTIEPSREAEPVTPAQHGASSAVTAEPQPPMGIRILLFACSLLLAIIWLGKERNFEALLGSFSIVGVAASLLAARKQVRWWAVGVGSVVFLLAGLYYVLSASSDANLVTRTVDINGAPVAQANVTLIYEGSATETVQTDERGIVIFPQISTSLEIILVVGAEGYKVKEQRIDVSRSRTVEVMLEREDPRERQILIRVIKGRLSRPVVGAEIDLIVGASVFSAITDNKGFARYSIAFNEQTLQAVLTMTADGKTVTNRNVTLRPDQFQEIHIDIEDEVTELE